MPISRTKKEEIYKRLGSMLKENESLVFVNFKGLKVAEVTSLRKTLRAKGVGYTVAKKTLVKKALADAKIAGKIPELTGELALVYGKDQIVPAKEIYAVQTARKEHIVILGGIFEKKFLNAAEIESLARIPSREELYGLYVGVLAAPLRGMVSALSRIPRGFVVALDQVAKTKTN